MCRKEVALISHHKYSENCLEKEVVSDRVRVLTEKILFLQQALGHGNNP